MLDGLNLASNALLIGVLVTLIRALDLTAFNVIVARLALVGLASRRVGPTTVLGRVLPFSAWSGTACDGQTGLTG